MRAKPALSVLVEGALSPEIWCARTWELVETGAPPPSGCPGCTWEFRFVVADDPIEAGDLCEMFRDHPLFRESPEGRQLSLGLARADDLLWASAEWAEEWDAYLFGVPLSGTNLAVEDYYVHAAGAYVYADGSSG